MSTRDNNATTEIRRKKEDKALPPPHQTAVPNVPVYTDSQPNAWMTRPPTGCIRQRSAPSGGRKGATLPRPSRSAHTKPATPSRKHCMLWATTTTCSKNPDARDAKHTTRLSRETTVEPANPSMSQSCGDSVYGTIHERRRRGNEARFETDGSGALSSVVALSDPKTHCSTGLTAGNVRVPSVSWDSAR